jgi:kynurenine formamidase
MQKFFLMKIERVVDLSVPLTSETQVYPGDPRVSFTAHSSIAADGFNLLAVTMGSQSGTHVDAPYHFDDATPRIDELPLELFVGEGVIVDARGAGPRGRITTRHLAPVLDRLEPGRIVLLKTAWSEHYGTPTYFDHPFLDSEACALLLARGIRTIGIDAINLDETPDEENPGEGFPCHHLIAEAGGVIIENLTALERIRADAPLISVLPLAFVGADGAPVRAVAIEGA